MRILLYFSFFLMMCFRLHGQTRTALWLSGEVSREIVKDISVNFNTNVRFVDPGGLNTLYQEVGVKYNGIKWLKPSIDYRLVTNYDDRDNYSNSNRLNFNLDFRHKIKDFRGGVRFRYQMYLSNQLGTGSDLDPSFRIKPYISWVNSKKKFIPQLSVEFFYNPVYGEFGRSFNRIRFGAGVEIDLPNKQSLEITYYFGNKFLANNPYYEHILSLGYAFEWKKSKAAKSE